MDKNENLEILTIYKNYLYSIEERKTYDDLYGDTDELMLLYEEELEKYNIKKLTK